MDKLNRILVVDDDESFKEDLVRSFEEEHVDVIFCSTKDDAYKKIDSRQHFDLLILDWFLEDPDNSLLAQLVLNYLYTKRFVPVFIWSKYIEAFNNERGTGSIKYPSILIEGISKDEITVDQLKGRIRQLLEHSLTAQISRVYRESIADNLETVFFELAEIQNEDLAYILKILVGSEENIDWSNDFILNLIHRKLLNDMQFIEKLKTLLLAASGSIGGEEHLEKRRKIINKFLYFHASPSFFRCGDIVGLKVGNKMLKYGIVVTPDCDIEHRNTRYLEIIEIRNIDDPELNLNSEQKGAVKKYNHDWLYYFPCLAIEEEPHTDFVAILKSKFIAEGLFEENEAKYPKVPQKLSYVDFFLVDGQQVRLIHVCSISNPYKSDFLQKLYANNSRVGTPDIKELLRL